MKRNNRAYTLTPGGTPVKGHTRMSTIAHRLAEVRAASGLGVRPFAERITQAGYAVSYGSVSAYEREDGTEKVPADYVAAVCDAFNINPSWLLLGTGPRERVQDGADPFRAGAAFAVEKMMTAIREIVEATGSGVDDGSDPYEQLAQEIQEAAYRAETRQRRQTK